MPTDTKGQKQEIVQFPLRTLHIKTISGETGYQAFESSLDPHPNIPSQKDHPLKTTLERCLKQPVDIPWNRLELTPYSDFQRTVWKKLTEITPGVTKTYGELAESIGRAGGAQAVGQALKSNPFPILLPCHRVIRSDGSLGGYGGVIGSPIKKKLLEWETNETPCK